MRKMTETYEHFIKMGMAKEQDFHLLCNLRRGTWEMNGGKRTEGSEEERQSDVRNPLTPNHLRGC